MIGDADLPIPRVGDQFKCHWTSDKNTFYVRRANALGCIWLRLDPYEDVSAQSHDNGWDWSRGTWAGIVRGTDPGWSYYPRAADCLLLPEGL